MAPVLLGPVTYVCPNCSSKLELPRLPGKPVLHPCRGLKGLVAPMVPEGLNCKVEALEREDYVGSDLPTYDEDGRAVMSVVTTRDEGTDCQVFVPTATRKADDSAVIAALTARAFAQPRSTDQ